MSQNTPPDEKTSSSRWWALGLVDGFNGRAAQSGLPDQFSYASGRVEGKAAREQGKTVDEVLEQAQLPYREHHFRPVRILGNSTDGIS